jgi:hypothetical protein
MKPDSTSFDVIIIGGGPAGIMAAISAKHHHPDYSVAILDRTFELGRKLVISGAGRGNITNNNLVHNPSKSFHGDQQFISSIFNQFGYEDIVKFFSSLGIEVYEEKKTTKGKIFPVIDHAKTVRDVLMNVLGEKGVHVYCDTTVTTLSKVDDTWHIKTNKQEYVSRFCIVSTGGKTYPALGSDGSGYALVAELGHTIVAPVVSAVPLVSKNQLSHLLQGEKITMQVMAQVGGKESGSSIGDVMFTQYGFSGPAILDISRDISIRIHREEKKDTSITLSFFPDIPREEVKRIVKKRLEQHPTFQVPHCLYGLLTQKASSAVCAVGKLPMERIARDVTEEEIEKLVDVLTQYQTEVTDTRGWNESEFTAGGINTGEIQEKTLESKKINGLYFAGEIINVDGPVGGFNLSWAWASGWVAGKI